MPLSHRDYTVACICPMGVELAPVEAMLEEIHPLLPTVREQNSYTLRKLGEHNVVVAVLPVVGNNAAAVVAVQLLNDFPAIRFGLLVGIGGGVPDPEEDGDDIRLGDVVISKPTSTFGGVVQYDLGKYSTSGGFERTGTLNKPPLLLRNSVESLVAAHRRKGSQVGQYLAEMLHKNPVMEEEYAHPGAQQDQLFQADYPHPGGPNCKNCDKQRVVDRDDRRNTSPKFHYGTIGSANTVVKDAVLREELRRVLKIKCVEMEVAGLMDSFPCLVIRGICDYADSHKNKKWQPYAAATAAAYMKELLSAIAAQEVTKIPNATTVVEISQYDKGLNLYDAPDIAERLFIGRGAELEKMQKVLQPSKSADLTRKVLILGGMGGIGKTQLTLAYA